MPSRHPLPKLNSSKIEDFRNLRELVTDRLRDAIALGELKPGQVLRQEALAAELRVSRQPIREAVRVLEHEGLIVRHGRSGLMVAPLTRTEIRDLYEFRAVLEQLVAERAVNGLSPDQILTIETIFRHAEDALSARDEARLIELDRAFHSELYMASGNAVVRDALARHWTDLARAMRIVLEVPGYPERAWQEHKAIFAALTRGDVERARRLSAAHSRSAGAHALEYMEQHPDEELKAEEASA